MRLQSILHCGLGCSFGVVRWRLPNFSNAQILGDLETGAIFGGPYNRIQIFTEEGTLFDAFSDRQFSTPIQPFVRLRAGYTIAKRHTIIALVAPLTIRSYTDGYGADILYQSTTFDANEALEVRYMFNSYRLTYRFHIIEKDKFTLALGATAKLRQAEIEVKSDQQSAINRNLGFVPIINFYLNYRPIEKLGIIFEGDALAIPNIPGRAEDVFLGVGYYVRENLAIKAGYRLLEGGSRNPESTTFIFVHYASVGVTWGM